MRDALIEFYYQFHTKQHYFLCHDILEDAWKSQVQYSKNDLVVSLILFVTASYHYRRNNLQGAYRSYVKAAKVVAQYNDKDLEKHGLKALDYREQLHTLIDATSQAKPFSPIVLSLTPIMQHAIESRYPDYEWHADIVETPLIMHHHRYRDRSEVIAAREAALGMRHNHLNQQND